ncbi:MAG: LD-carboxypeptidase [Desulfobulbus propionicus]|nr:MAG: LD-carboxypeptidase [Desulfobulbus propionicus]
MTNRPTLPPPLRRGDCLGLFSPASPVRQPRVQEQATRILKEMGFTVKLAEQRPGPCEYLAGDDQWRADNLMRLWMDTAVKGLVAIRGGYGCQRMVDLLDLDALRSTPKRMIGFSDVSVLLNVLADRGLVTLHGPVLTSLPTITDNSRQRFLTALTAEPQDLQLRQCLEVLRPGTARGRLLGGNLTTLVHLIGTRHEPRWDGALLLLEDTGEALYRLDRLLTQLQMTGILARLAGVLLGTFDLGPDDTVGNLRLQEGVWQRVLELTDHCPVWGNFPSGHLTENWCLPLGMEATMDSRAGQLLFHPQSVDNQ